MNNPKYRIKDKADMMAICIHYVNIEVATTITEFLFTGKHDFRFIKDTHENLLDKASELAFNFRAEGITTVEKAYKALCEAYKHEIRGLLHN
ncbi:hypothetical protein ABEX38_29805 [Priestia megaterium]